MARQWPVADPSGVAPRSQASSLYWLVAVGLAAYLPSMTTSHIRSPLTAEIGNPESPVRQFLNERFTVGLRDVQRRYRDSAPSQVVPPVSRSEANPGTVGTAADWLLRFLLHPSPAPELAMAGVALCRNMGIDLAPAFVQIARHLGLQLPKAPGHAQVFTGPRPGSLVEGEMLARSCWALALLTEVYRGGPPVLMGGPLGQFRGRKASGADLLALCPHVGLDQLDAVSTAIRDRAHSPACDPPWPVGDGPYI